MIRCRMSYRTRCEDGNDTNNFAHPLNRPAFVISPYVYNQKTSLGLFLPKFQDWHEYLLWIMVQ